MLKGKKILIIEDEEKIASVIQAYLEKEGCTVWLAADGEAGLFSFQDNQPDLILLDRMLPKRSGESVCMEIRKKSRVPIIMLTARVREEEMIEGFSMGADDYITKPFRMGELLARIEAVLRRLGSSSMPLFQTISWNEGDLVIDIREQSVIKNGKPVALTPNEWKLFQLFVSHPRQIFTREQMIETVFGPDYDGYDRTIDVHIKNLRSKIETDSARPEYIQTVRGTGYRFTGERKDSTNC